MTRRIFWGMLICSLAFISACSKSKSSTPTGPSETPVAKAQYDNSNYGVYKGVFTGSSGTILIDIKNSGSVSASLKINELVYTFLTSSTITENQATEVEFKNNDNTFIFSVGADGSNPQVLSLDIDGEPDARISVFKERSSAIVKCYEGTYTGDETGIVNFITYNGQVKGLVKNNSSSVTDVAAGAVNNNQVILTGTLTPPPAFSGTLTGNNLSGTWTKSTNTGTWTAARTY
ncbi:MAG: hypothetical protein QM791_18985 [Ferruginibacter sp.]